MSKTISERLFDACRYIGPECYDALRALMIEAAVMLENHDPEYVKKKPLSVYKAAEGFSSIPHPTHNLQAFIAGVRFAEREHGIEEKP